MRLLQAKSLRNDGIKIRHRDEESVLKKISRKEMRLLQAKSLTAMTAIKYVIAMKEAI